MIIYLKNCMTAWNLITDANNIVSHDILTLISKIPSSVILCAYYIFLVLALISIFRNSRSIMNILIYMIAFIILSLGLKITANLLCFEDYTNYAFIKIYHPISLEAKQQYLFMQLDLLLRHNQPETYMNPDKMQWYINKLKEQLQEIDWATFKEYSPSEIQQYASYMLNNCQSSTMEQILDTLIITITISCFTIIVTLFHDNFLPAFQWLRAHT